MAKGEKIKALWDGVKNSNRFWGIAMMVVGAPLTLIPAVAPLGMLMFTTGLPVAITGTVNAAKRAAEEKKNPTDKVESKIN